MVLLVAALLLPGVHRPHSASLCGEQPCLAGVEGGEGGRGVVAHQGGEAWPREQREVVRHSDLGSGVPYSVCREGAVLWLAHPGLGPAHGQLGEAGQGVVAVAGGHHRVGDGLLHVVLLRIELEGGAEAGVAGHLAVALPDPPDVEGGQEDDEQHHGGRGGAQGDEEGGGDGGEVICSRVSTWAATLSVQGKGSLNLSL